MSVTRHLISPIDFHSMGPINCLVTHILLLCSTEVINSYRFGTTWGWVNDDRIVILGSSIPLRCVFSHPITSGQQLCHNTRRKTNFIYYLWPPGWFQQNQDWRSQPARHKDVGKWLNPYKKCFVSLFPSLLYLQQCTCAFTMVLTWPVCTYALITPSMLYLESVVVCLS